MRSVALLPEELSRANEGSGVLELPSHYVCPLVQREREVSVRMDPLGIAGVHNGLTGGPNGDGLLQVGLAGLGDPGDFGGETLNVIFLLAEGCLGDEHGEVAVGDTVLLEAGVEEALD